MLLQVVLKFTLPEDMIVPFINNRFLVHIDFTALEIKVLEILLVLKMQMPRYEHILLGEFLLAYAFVALEVLLKGPYVNEAQTPNLEDPGHLVDCPMADLLCRKVVDHCD
jgi:hypothetical protein